MPEHQVGGREVADQILAAGQCGVDEIPKTASEKSQERFLQDRFADEAAPIVGAAWVPSAVSGAAICPCSPRLSGHGSETT